LPTILVCGSRDWTDADIIRHALERHARPGGVLVHGAARGADTIAEWEGMRLGYAIRAFPADWEKHGKRAGILRNLTMLDAGPDLVLAFQRNGSRGTQHTLDEANRRGIPVEVHTA
jgi:hypothetical protein